MKLVNFTHFYVAPENVSTDYFVLTEDEAKHAARVLRKQEGEQLTAVDGNGHLYIGTISTMEKRQIIVKIDEIIENLGETLTKLTIVQGAPKGNRFDLVIEKGTEIGVYCFQPVITARSIIKPDTRIDRWQQKAIAAMKQCGRSCCPKIYAPIAFLDFIDTFTGKMFIAHENVDDSLSQPTLSKGENIALLIGPEGGFTQDEYNHALEKGAIPLHLGERRLRSETAALVGAVKLLHLANELN